MTKLKKTILDKKTWTLFRPSLNGSYEISAEWSRVIDLFRQRIEDFYLNPIEKIAEPKKMKGEGFSIVTLQCVLIEMFAAFKYGEIHNRNKPNTGGLNFEYKWSNSCFNKFLRSEMIFKDHFFKIDGNGTILPDQPYSAEEFYDCVRCGLMHEARTKRDWRIIASASKAPPGKVFITTDVDGTKIVHRTKLNEVLRSYFKDTYLVNLKQTTPDGKTLRRLLARKLDHLHDIPRDTTYDWWLDT